MENGRVVVPLADPAVHPAAVRRCAVRALEFADGLPAGKPDLQLIPRLVGQVSKGGVTRPPECPGAVVAHLEVAVDHDDLAMLVGSLHDLPQRAQPSAAGAGDDQIGVDRIHG